MELYDALKKAMGELHDLQGKYEQVSNDREQYQRWWLDERELRMKAEEKLAELQAQEA
jgi:hypothetical protein